MVIADAMLTMLGGAWLGKKYPGWLGKKLGPYDGVGAGLYPSIGVTWCAPVICCFFFLKRRTSPASASERCTQPFIKKRRGSKSLRVYKAKFKGNAVPIQNKIRTKSDIKAHVPMKRKQLRRDPSSMLPATPVEYSPNDRHQPRTA